jgi:O-antigen/teichoic acid export membrane protein
MAGRLMAYATAVALPRVDRLRTVGPRSRRLGMAVVSTLAGRLVSLAVQLVQMPLLVAAVGADRFGEAVAVVAFLGLLTGFDLGFGAAVKNAAADLLGRHQAGGLTALLLTSAAWSAGLAMLVAGLVVCAPHWLAPLPGSDSILPMLGGDAATRWLLIALLGLGLPLAIATHCAEGMQLLWLVNACRIVAAGIGLGVIVTVAAVVSQRWQVVALLAMIPLLSSALTWLALWRQLPRRSRGSEPAPPLPQLIRQGLPFMLPIVGSLLAANAPQLAILAADGSPAVTRYVVGQRLMTLLIQPLMFAVGPLWPAFAEARATGDRAWVVRQLRRAATAGAAYCVVVTMIAIVGGRWAAMLWIGRPEGVPTAAEMAAIAVAAGVSAAVQPGAMLLNAYRRFRMSTVVAILQIGLALAYEPLARLAGPAAVPAAQAIFGLLVVVPAVIVDSRAALRQ